MTALIQEKLAAMASEFRLSVGKHASPQDGLCAMELVAFLDGQKHSDRPRCLSPAIGDYVRFLNDHIPEELRSRLLPFVPRLIGTASNEQEQERIEYLAWQTIRVFAPAALRAQGYKRFPARLEKAQTLFEAQMTAAEIRKQLGGRHLLKPVDLAVHRAYHAAAAADCTARNPDNLMCFFGEYTACGYLAASACFQAHQAGCPDDIWERAFETLDGALAIGTPEPSVEALPATPAASPMGHRASNREDSLAPS